MIVVLPPQPTSTVNSRKLMAARNMSARYRTLIPRSKSYPSFGNSPRRSRCTSASTVLAASAWNSCDAYLRVVFIDPNGDPDDEDVLYRCE